jgi:predicted metal-dependent phosphoesterase TrpH
MHEIVVNLHMHTRYSDGSGTHKDIAHAAIQSGVEAVIVTDHNVLVQGVEGYYRVGSTRVLLLIGQEIHDQDRDPQKNHLLVFNANRDLASLADDPQVQRVGIMERVKRTQDVNPDPTAWSLLCALPQPGRPSPHPRGDPALG